jgi:hypothetical protein
VTSGARTPTTLEERVIGGHRRYKLLGVMRTSPDSCRKFEAKKSAVHKLLKNGEVTTGLSLEERWKETRVEILLVGNCRLHYRSRQGK